MRGRNALPGWPSLAVALRALRAFRAYPYESQRRLAESSVRRSWRSRVVRRGPARTAARRVVGHGYHRILGGGFSAPAEVAEAEAIRIENQYHRARGNPQRCNEGIYGVMAVAPADAANVPVIIP